MPLIKNGELAEPCTAESISLADFLIEPNSILSRNTPFSVVLAPGDDPSELAPHLSQISVIKVEFPKYTDGRGYSHAQLLRRRYGYEGELRAVGHVLTDQILYMHRSGFDAFETSRAGLSSVLKALEEYSDVYQPAAGGRMSVFEKRHR